MCYEGIVGGWWRWKSNISGSVKKMYCGEGGMGVKEVRRIWVEIVGHYLSEQKLRYSLKYNQQNVNGS